MSYIQSDIARTTLSVLFIGVLISASLWVLRPFLPALIWATMIVVPTWGLMRAVQAHLWGKRNLAVIVMTLILLLTFVVPFLLAIETIVSHADTIIAWVKSLAAFDLPPAPAWVEGLPLIGAKAAESWNDLAARSAGEFGRLVAPYARQFAIRVLAELGNFGLLTLQFLLTVVIAAILYATGEQALERLHRLGRRLAGERGERAVHLAGQAIRGVALGIVVTAFVQALFGGVGLAIAGVPFAAVLTALMFLLAVIQIGAGPVMLIATIWMFWQGDYAWGVALAVWTVIVTSMDNILRPLLIRRGAGLPLLLIFAGVIGGLVAFGLVGIFIGPIVLAVTYTLFEAWLQETPTEAVPVQVAERDRIDQA